ncbi:PQQ-dependent sugar dehydrogenase [Halalkalicoccus tibetensis]|uniref:PQQ-dependent sugar dehydrogenase n=1 Tax=Halalkalicoccus tibetensis TaxID=175632 RepID=A0ABD5V1Y1_9EURY
MRDNKQTRRRVLQAVGAMGASSITIGSATAEEGESTGYEVERLDAGLDHAWGIAFLPDDARILVTEREGRLNRVDRDDGSVETIDGVPEVHAEDQGGLLDVAVHPDYPGEPWVYLTYSAPGEGEESTTRLGRGRLDPDGDALEGFEVLHTVEPFDDSTMHYGSRIAFDEECRLYMSVGDRRFTEFGPDHVSQDTTNDIGTTLRFEPDGSAPEDNPLVDDEEASDAIYSYGHRNVQAMAFHPETGELWQGEHGEEAGDEINVIEAGGNYGWPVAHYGCEYETEIPVGDLPHEREDTVDPVYYWECPDDGFPPSGATFYDGDAFPEWQGDLLMGNIFWEYLGRFSVDGHEVQEVDPLLADCGWRIRDVEVAPDTGHIYVLLDEEDAPVVRIVPE